MTFEPTPITGGFICPCTDAYGEQARLVELYHEKITDKLPDGRTIQNYECDQNRDQWQLIAAPGGAATWHYIGRRHA